MLTQFVVFRHLLKGGDNDKKKVFFFIFNDLKFLFFSDTILRLKESQCSSVGRAAHS